MIRVCLARGLVRLAACYDRLADGLDACAPRSMYPADHPGHATKERAVALRTSAVKLRRSAIGIMMPRRPRW